MKKSFIAVLSALALLTTSCFSGLGNSNSGNSGLLSGIFGILGNVLGMGFTSDDLQGNWTYNAPSAAFTSEKAYNNAGGAAATTNLVSSLAPTYQNMGINKSNTAFNFGSNNTFTAKVGGIPFTGTYTYNEKTGEITLKTGTQTIKGNVTKTQNGMGLMFDAKQMVSMLQNVGQVTNKAAVDAVSQLAKSTDGARVGFELTK